MFVFTTMVDHCGEKFDNLDKKGTKRKNSKRNPSCFSGMSSGFYEPNQCVFEKLETRLNISTSKRSCRKYNFVHR